MPSVRATLERVRDRFVPPPGGFDRLVARRQRWQRTQRLTAAAVALALSGGAIVGLFWAFPRGETPRPVGSIPPPILFTREEPGGGSDLFTMNPDGSGLRQLTRTPGAFEGDPAWSPDGTKIAVSLELRDIAVIDAATLEVERLTDDPEVLDSSPSWSPDGSKILFDREPGRAARDIYVMNADGTQLQRLTDGEGDYLNPAWSPDGARIAFSGSTRQDAGLYLMDPDGSGLTLVIENGEGHSRPAWSPDGTRIAFDLSGAIHVVDSDGSGLKRLSPEGLPEEAFDMQPSWSPDGTRIIFTRWRNDVLEEVGGDGDIWIMNADGTDATRLTSGPVVDSAPAWGPTPTATIAPEPSIDPTPTGAAGEDHTGPTPGAFYPTTYRGDGKVVMPIAFIDGSSAEVLFDEELRPDELGAYGEIAGGLTRIDRSIYFRYGTSSQFKGSGPLATYEGRGGTTVEEWEPLPETFAAFTEPTCPTLVFEFGD